MPTGPGAPGPLAAGPGDLARATQNQVIDAVMRLYGGALVVLDEQRRVVASNTAYLDLLGLERPGLGLRLGDAAGCTFGQDQGCGQAEACGACGAHLAIGEALDTGARAERDCALRVRRGGEAYDLALHVHAVPLGGTPGRLLLTLTDTSPERRRAAVQGVLLDELSNLVAALGMTSEQLAARAPPQLGPLVDDLADIAARFAGELQVQQVLVAARAGVSAPAGHAVDLDALVGGLSTAMRRHPAAHGKALATAVRAPHGTLAADRHLLQRVLVHLLVNAFEATAPGGEVRLVVEERPPGVEFAVWSAAPIPPEVAPRIFQRYFTTKPGAGRGHGTYLAKLLGEQVLGGEVGFTSGAAEGTTFRVRVPLAGAGVDAAPRPCEPAPALTPVPGLRRVRGDA